MMLEIAHVNLSATIDADIRHLAFLAPFSHGARALTQQHGHIARTGKVLPALFLIHRQVLADQLGRPGIQQLIELGPLVEVFTFLRGRFVSHRLFPPCLEVFPRLQGKTYLGVGEWPVHAFMRLDLRRSDVFMGSAPA